MTEKSSACLIACGIFKDELEKLVDEGPLDAEMHFLDPGLHNNPKHLEIELSKSIERHLEHNPNGIILVYGDVCLGFSGEIRQLVEKYSVVKIDALNCIDCLLGGKGKLLGIDPNHEYFFLNPAWIKLEFGNRDLTRKTQEARKEFSVLKGLFLLDTLGNLNDFEKEIEDIRKYTDLPVVERRNIGIRGIQSVITEAIHQL